MKKRCVSQCNGDETQPIHWHAQKFMLSVGDAQQCLFLNQSPNGRETIDLAYVNLTADIYGQISSYIGGIWIISGQYKCVFVVTNNCFIKSMNLLYMLHLYTQRLHESSIAKFW